MITLILEGFCLLERRFEDFGGGGINGKD